MQSRFIVPPDAFRILWKANRLFFLLSAELTYLLGAGIARYLSFQPAPTIVFSGAGIVASLAFTTYFLERSFNLSAAAARLGRRYLKLFDWRTIMLLAAGLTLTCCVTLILLLIRLESFNSLAMLTTLAGVVVCVLYSTPPLRLIESAYGEFVPTLLVTSLAPLFGFVLLAGEVHRLLPMATFPLTGLHLALMIVCDLPDYAEDQRKGKRNLLNAMGWQNAIQTHNLLVLGSFAALGLASFFGLPAFAALPAILPLPLAALSVIYLNRIVAGSPVNWNGLLLLSTSAYGSLAYILVVAFWSH